MNRDAAKPEMKSTQSEEKSPGAGKAQRADEGMQGQKSQGQKSTTVGSDEKADQKSKSMSSENDNAKGGKDMKAEGRQDRNGKMNANSKGGAEGKTVGQAGAGAKLSTEQRTKITTVIKQQHVAPVTNVNFSISVGTRVPRDVSFHPLPAEIVTIYPDWRGYEFILVRDQIVVIDPEFAGDRRCARRLIRLRRRRSGRAAMPALRRGRKPLAEPLGLPGSSTASVL